MAAGRLAIVTPSYAGDHQRCVLLAESLDRMATSDFQHYILVADHDLPLFKPMAGPRRHIVPDSHLLPGWLKPVTRPFSGGKTMWASLVPLVWPMSGWHIQQLRKLLIARHIDEDVMVMADSDSVFVRPFGAQSFEQNGLVRLYAKDGGITTEPAYNRHRRWTAHAATLFGSSPPTWPACDYINNLVSWRRQHVITMLDVIEQRSGRDLAATLGRARTFSEYQIYGAYVDGLAGRVGHFADAEPLSLTYWQGEALTEISLKAFVSKLSPQQIAICVQSFTGTSPALLRSYICDRANAL